MSQMDITVENPEVLQNNPQVQQVLQQVAPVVNTALQTGAPIDATVAQDQQPQGGGVDFNALQQLQQQQPQGVDFGALQQLQQQPVMEPQTPAPTNPQAKDDPLGAFGKGLDMLDDITRKGVGAGILDAVVNAGEFVTSTSKFIHDIWDKGWDKARYKESNWDTVRGAIMPDAPTTLAGDIAKGIGQWATGFLVSGGVGNAAGITQATTKVGRYAQVLGRGAATDALFFDRQQDRLADFINNNFPELANPVTNYLAAKGKDENMAESMLKMTVEGMGLSLAVDSLVKGLKCLKAGKKYFETPSAKNAEEYEKAAQDLDNSRSKPNEGTDATGTKPDSGDTAPAVRQTADNAEQTGPSTGKKGDSTKMDAEVLGPEPEPRKSEKSNLKENQFHSVDEIQAEINERLKSGTPMSGVRDTINLNHDTFSNPDGATVMGTIADMQAENALKNVKGREAHQKILDDVMSDLKNMGFTYDGLMAEAKQSIKGLEHITRTAAKVQVVMHTMSNAATELANKLYHGLGTAEDKAMLTAIYRNMQEFVTLNADLRTTSGRLLSARNAEITDEMVAKAMNEGLFGKNWFTPENLTEEGFAKFMKDNGVDDHTLNQIVNSLRLADAQEGTIGVAKMLQKVKPGWTFRDALVEYRVNSMLSGPVTHLVNFGGSFANIAVVKPMERLIGSVMTWDKQGMRSAWNYMRGEAHGFMEAWKQAGNALKMGDNILDAAGGSSRVEHHAMHVTTYENIRAKLLEGKPAGTELSPNQERLARAMGWIGAATRIPSRLLQAEDEFCKQLAFRGQLFADISEEAFQKYGLTNVNDLKAYMQERLKDAVTPEGHVIENDLTKKAIKAARDGTWTSPLEAGTFASKLQGLINQSFAMKMIVPFFKTPMNLFYDSMRHCPLPIMKEVREAIKAGGEARADALGRIAVGSMFVTGGLMAASEGRITGAAPKNDKEAALWRANGIEPYSIRIGDKWYEYRRFDPFAMLLSCTADSYAKVAYDNADGSEDSLIDNSVTRALHGTLIAITNNLMDKTYLQGISDAVKAMDDPERYMGRYINTVASSFVPYSGAARWATNSFTDPAQREMDGLMDYIRNSVPGGQAIPGMFGMKEMPIKHDWITGQPVQYRGAIMRDAVDDKVKQELLHLGTSVLGTPTRKIGGIDLTPEQYARYCELHGSLKLGGKTMIQMLEKIIDSPGYDAKRERFGDGREGMDSPRSQLVNKVINLYREAAQHKMRVEFPELAKEEAKAKLEMRGSKAGVLQAPKGAGGKYDKLVNFGKI